MSVIAETNETIKRIPWKEFLSKQLYKIIGFIIVASLIIGVMIISELMGNLEDISRSDTLYLIAVALSSMCFILVLFGFSKIVLFDMGQEFGLRDPETKKIRFNFRFFLFGSLSLSFCSAIYLLLDVFLRSTYLELLPVLAMEWVLISFNLDIPGLTDIEDRTEFYQTVRNIYFDFFFIVIITFSVIVFLSILTSLARRRLVSKFKKEEIDAQEEEKENRVIYKLLLWIFTPLINIFLLGVTASIGNSAPLLVFILFFLMLGLTIWWVYQLFKIIFLVLWRGFKFTAFLTSVNALIVIPLIFVLYLVPVLSWVAYDIWNGVQAGLISPDFANVLQAAAHFIQFRARDFFAILELDFVIITVVATFIVGFAEGFAIVAIFSAIYRGVEVAKTGQIIARSPPKVAVISKYLVMFGVWFGMVWDSFIEVWTMLIEELHIQLPR
ncbi:MAG: hypothetical protein ACTSPV_19245, partial [Candidatus Hodarchaeales archaeon]